MDKTFRPLLHKLQPTYYNFLQNVCMRMNKRTDWMTGYYIEILIAKSPFMMDTNLCGYHLQFPACLSYLEHAVAFQLLLPY
jgi:hypothetical protein